MLVHHAASGQLESSKRKMEEGVYKETAVSYNRIQQIRTTAEILYKNSKKLEFYWLTEQSNHLNYLRNTLQLIHIPSQPPQKD